MAPIRTILYGVENSCACRAPVRLLGEIMRPRGRLPGIYWHLTNGSPQHLEIPKAVANGTPQPKFDRHAGKNGTIREMTAAGKERLEHRRKRANSVRNLSTE